MIEQTYFLDMIPGESTPPVVHVSQFDVNSRTLTFNLMKGGVAYVPDAGMSVTLDGTKPDGTAFSYPMTVNGSSVSINVQTQMTVVSGHVKCEVSVSNVSGKIGSANFILAVEESAIDDGAISETDIPIFEDLKNQAQQAAASAEQYASDAETAASSVSSIVPASSGTPGQVLTKTTTGADWQDVDGLPAGGTTGQVLTKQSSTDGDADWETPTGGQWGGITGTLSDQTDLQTALDAKANASNLATIESSTTASQAYSAGDYLVLNGQLYEVTTAISSGETLTVGTNISATTVGSELTSLNNGLTDLNGAYENETLLTFYTDVKASLFKGFASTGAFTQKLTNNFASGAGTGYAAYNSQYDFVEGVFYMNSNKRLYAFRIGSDGVLSGCAYLAMTSA